MSNINCSMPMSADQVQQGFLAAPPLIAEQILDLTVQRPMWLQDLYTITPFPFGNGTRAEQLIFRGAMPQIERGFNQWRTEANNQGCDPCSGPDCAYNWTPMGGYGIQRKAAQLMHRDFQSPEYCVKEIQTTAHFEQVFSQIVKNLYQQVAFFKEMNIGFNALTGLAKKFVVDSNGPQPNTQNPYVYANTGTARLSALNMEMLEYFYEWMRRAVEAVPYDVVDGAPIFALEASHQLLSRLYRDDPTLRQDVRFSGLANDSLTKYNFMSTIRGMFIAAPILYPRRFNLVDGDAIEVLPFVNGVPADVGAYTTLNPLYEAATHEEVLLHGKFPFTIWFQPTLTTLGENSSFGPEQSFMTAWQWINPMTVQDPFRRVGFFATSATIAIAPQFSEYIYGVLVERPSKKLTAMWMPTPECPPVDPSCNNAIPAQDAPQPLVLNVVAHPITADVYFLQLSVPTDAAADDTLSVGLDTGGYVNTLVVSVSADGLTVEVESTVDLSNCNVTSLFCVNNMECSAQVLQYAVNCSDATRLNLILSNPIKADTAADAVTLYYGNGTTQSATVVSVDMTNNTWIVDIGATAFCNQVGGVVSICTPTATDASCPTCGGEPTFTQENSDCGVTPAP